MYGYKILLMPIIVNACLHHGRRWGNTEESCEGASHKIGCKGKSSTVRKGEIVYSFLFVIRYMFLCMHVLLLIHVLGYVCV